MIYCEDCRTLSGDGIMTKCYHCDIDIRVNGYWLNFPCKVPINSCNRCKDND